MDESPYVFDRGSGLVHIRLRVSPAGCIGDVRLDVYDIVYQEAYRQGMRDAIEAVKRSALNSSGGR